MFRTMISRIQRMSGGLGGDFPLAGGCAVSCF